LIRQSLLKPTAQLSALLLVALMIAGCALLPAGRSEQVASDAPTPTPIPTPIVPVKPTYKVQQGEVIKELTVSGRVSPITEQELFFQSSGRVRTVHVKRNEMIKANTVIAELEIDALERELVSAELELERAQVTLDEAKLDLEYAQKIAQTNLEIAQIRLNSLQSQPNPDKEAIQLQAKQVELAQLEVKKLNRGVNILLTNDFERANYNVVKLKAQIDESRIIAPFDGQILSIALTPGQDVEGYRPQVTLADVNSLEVSADLLSDQMNDLVEGMPIKVEQVSRPGEFLAGIIRRLPYPFGSGGGKSNTVEDLDKSSRFTVEGLTAEKGFTQGDLVRVTVELERKADVLWLPPQALRVFDGRRFAVVQDGDAQRRVDVTVGIQTTERIEIKEGLELGQVVVGQ
jgi:multidrug efflux pump subunit AcrA (membrane-fusion protein)